ncbi:hypothetical protein EI94DRAFT_1782567 [Lactarius quietus]|nr:hypothetical protein EI94DRAFT_1782567 [Lactarius quietus]
MNPVQANSWERIQQAIDVQIKSLEESTRATIRALRFRRNAHSPISSLPPEVLAAIFSFLCLPGVPSLGGKPDNHLARLRVSHVCHQWREIVLNQPFLWSHVDFTTVSLTRVTETLIRAKSVPLYFEARFSSCQCDNVRVSTFQKELEAHIPRICHLSITAKHFLLRCTLEGFVSPTPTLEYLSLSSCGGEELFIPDTLFDGSAPRLSCLKLRNCNISWKSPFLKGLKYVEILMPSEDARPELEVWLAALDQMSLLRTLTLHSASPIASPFLFDVKRTITLPFLIHLDISASPLDCTLALAHLDLPALTSLCLTVIYHLTDRRNVHKLLPHPASAERAHPQLCNDLGILVWPVPGIDAEVHDPPTFLGATLPTRVTLTFRSKDRDGSDAHRRILDMVMVALPLDDLVMFTAQGLDELGPLAEDLSRKSLLWFRHSPQWALLRRVRLAPPADLGFIKMLLEGNGGSENPLLPSLTELVLVYAYLYQLPLCDALMKRVEQGVPLEMLDLRLCLPDLDNAAAVQLLSEIVIDVLGPEETFEAVEQIESMWDPLVARGPFIEETDPDTEDDDDH